MPTNAFAALSVKKTRQDPVHESRRKALNVYHLKIIVTAPCYRSNSFVIMDPFSNVILIVHLKCISQGWQDRSAACEVSVELYRAKIHRMLTVLSDTVKTEFPKPSELPVNVEQDAAS
ncbi:hypothetical protein STEG23_015074 [Scotinomys teguina]